MAPTTIKFAIKGMLEDMRKEQLTQFTSELLDRRQEPRVKYRDVEDKDIYHLTNVLVSTFCELGALEVVLETLRAIRMLDAADRLERDTRHLCKPPVSSDVEKGKHFVDKHREVLIDRVNMVASILDRLLDMDVVNQECYDCIMAKSTSYDRMRELYRGALKSCGDSGKDIFYDILLEKEKLLMAELKKLP